MRISARLIIVLAMSMSWVCASSEVHTLTCGTVIDVSAEPYEGYHFVRWADGNTEARRTIEVSSDLFFNSPF